MESSELFEVVGIYMTTRHDHASNDQAPMMFK